MSEIKQLEAKAAAAEQQLAQLQAELSRLQAKMNGASSQAGSEDSKHEEKEEKSKKKEVKKLDLPMKLIEDEAVLISEKGNDATMRVTICNGESNPPFISAKGIKWLKNNFHTNEKDVFVDTYAKCGTTLCIKLVYKVFESAGVVCDGASAEVTFNFIFIYLFFL